MRIALVAPHILKVPTDGYGGLESCVFDLAVELDGMGHHVSLYAAEGSYIPPKGAYFTAGPAGKGISDEAAMTGFLAHTEASRFLKEADVVHDNTWDYSSYALKESNPNAPVMHTHHGMNPGFEGKPPYPLCAVGISSSHAHALTQMSGLPFRFVYNGVNPERYPFQEEKGKRLLFLSRLAPFKGPLEAIQIAEKAKVPIDIVGGSFGDPGDFVQAVKAACSKSEYAKFHGEVDHKTKVSMMQNARAVIVPVQVAANGAGSFWREPFGLFPVEANMCGTPVITASNGGLKENVRHTRTGFLCNSEGEYLDAISRVDDLQPKHCRQWAVENFSAHRMALEYVRLYKAISEKGERW